MRSRTSQFSAVIAAGVHLFPFRTEKLSPPAPMVLGGQPPGRVGRRRISSRALRGPFLGHGRELGSSSRSRRIRSSMPGWVEKSAATPCSSNGLTMCSGSVAGLPAKVTRSAAWSRRSQGVREAVRRIAELGRARGRLRTRACGDSRSMRPIDRGDRPEHEEERALQEAAEAGELDAASAPTTRRPSARARLGAADVGDLVGEDCPRARPRCRSRRAARAQRRSSAAAATAGRRGRAERRIGDQVESRTTGPRPAPRGARASRGAAAPRPAAAAGARRPVPKTTRSP